MSRGEDKMGKLAVGGGISKGGGNVSKVDTIYCIRRIDHFFMWRKHSERVIYARDASFKCIYVRG